jgi:hypothetical protein
MALNEYARLPLFVNGTYLSQLTSVEASLESGQQRVDLLNEGFGGFTSGSGSTTISIGFAVPIGGSEYSFWNDCVNGALADLQLGMGSESYGGRGKFTDVRISQSVNASVEGSVTWIGEFNALK